MKTIPSIKDAKPLPIKGPWSTKSGGELSVLLAFDKETLEKFLEYDDAEMEKIGQNINGLRIYRVTGLHEGVVGANEWHRIRNEFTIVTKGQVKWTLLDTDGKESQYIMDPSTGGLLIPHYIMHTYEVMAEGSEIMTLASTLYDPNDPATHDTYSPTVFYAP